MSSEVEDLRAEVENTLQDYGYRIEQLEQNTDLSDRIEEIEKDLNRVLGLIVIQTKVLASVQTNQELITAKLP
jgi:hypothetical protein